ncbi:hypothetical protein [Arsukibacterium sp.]|uniref:hypothetical protein n=1 Tax=Arsukibacterium sp. TaxID=1977258 RepID=UPI001BD2F44D|nr:hypothetical protein [Arsukibacterium sp.]
MALQQTFGRDHYYNSMVVGDLGNKVFPPVSAKEAFLDNYHYLKKRVYDNGLPNFGRIQVFRNEAAIAPGHCLVFGSSSSYSMLSYLTRVFTTLTLVHSAGNTDAALVRQLKPDYLVGQTNERFAVRAPTIDYKVADAIAQKLNGYSATELAQQTAALEQKYPFADDPLIAVLHAMYSSKNG